MIRRKCGSPRYLVRHVIADGTGFRFVPTRHDGDDRDVPVAGGKTIAVDIGDNEATGLAHGGKGQEQREK